MATFLYRLGRFAFRRRHFVALVWVLLLTVVGVAAANAPAAGGSSFSIPGTEAQKAFDLLNERFPGMSADGATARVVFKAPAGEKITNAANKATVEQTVKELRAGAEVGAVTDPFTSRAVSQDRTIAYAQVKYTVPSMTMKGSTKDFLKKTVDEPRHAGLTVEVGGDALQATPETGAGEVVGVAIAAVVLIVTLGSLVAAGLPLLTALIGVGIGVSGITALAKALDLGSTTSILAMMIGLAVGIDYALFIVSRYRAELAEGRERDEAVGRAAGTAGSAVVFAGLTVVIALVGLAVVNVPMLTKMGIAAAGTVAIAVLIALTMIPALLGYAGRRIQPAGKKSRLLGGKKSKHSAGAEAKPNMGTRWATFIVRRPAAVLLLCMVGLGVAAAPVSGLKLGLGDDGTQPTSTTQRRAYDLLSEGFGPGFNGPLMVVVDAKASSDPKAAAATVTDDIKGLTDVATVTPAVFNKAGDTATITVIPASKPSSTQTEDLVHAIRDKADGVRADTNARMLVTGTTAMNIDFSQKLSDALIPYLCLVVGLAFLLLMVVFRSILVPLKAALGFLLSVLAALGAVVAVFQWGWLADLLGVQQTGPIMSMMPIFMIGVVFGLAMDYEVFLVTRMREAYVHGEQPKQAVVTGFKHGARVVTAAAIIMIAVFSGFITSSESMIKMMGFGLAIAVFFDAFIVRMAIVPAVLALLGKAAWWLPKWLDRILPNVDVEGEGLRARSEDRSELSEIPLAEPQPVREPVLVGAGAPQAPAYASQAQAYAPQAQAGALQAQAQPLAAYASAGGGDAVPASGGPSIGGQVRGSEGAGVGGATLTLVSLTGHQLGRAVARTDGRYSLDAPGSGSYILIAVADGHQPQASTVMVSDSAEPVTYDVLLAGTSGLAGTVTDASRHLPIEGAMVAVTDVLGEVVARAESDRRGTFLITDLPAGDVTVAVNAAGHRPTALPVVISGAGMTRLEVVLRSGVQLQGVVRAGAEQNPLPDARVTLVDAAGNVVATATTGSDGAYAFADLDAGDYLLIAGGYPPIATALTVDGKGADGFDLELSHPER
ncbi:MMPL family transporter [Actinoallomurus sp. CA-150999]|uniref:MMPL family transporter n=1 Tax=Actinoallomurus sp. CA-150999 TaxID=3239887 RepID=UPI003D906186